MVKKIIISAIISALMPVCAFAQGEIQEWQPDRGKKMMLFTKANLVNIGLGAECEGFYNYGAGARLEWRAGSERQLINAIAGWEIIWHNHIHKEKPNIIYVQNSPYFAFRINYARMAPGSLYLEGGMSYNINAGEKYRIADRETSDKLLARNHFSTSMRMGYVTDRYDISVFARYDLKPTFNQKYIYETGSFDYYAMKKALNERWSIGLCMLWYFRK